jgi:hypothetical protein
LTVKVVELNCVLVNKNEMPDARQGQIQGRYCSDPPYPDHRDP